MGASARPNLTLHGAIQRHTQTQREGQVAQILTLSFSLIPGQLWQGSPDDPSLPTRPSALGQAGRLVILLFPMSSGANNKSQSPPCRGHRLHAGGHCWLQHSQPCKLGMLDPCANSSETWPGPGRQLQGRRYQLAGKIKNKPSQSNVNMDLNVTWSHPAGRQLSKLAISQPLSKSCFSALKRCRIEQRGQGASFSIISSSLQLLGLRKDAVAVQYTYTHIHIFSKLPTP